MLTSMLTFHIHSISMADKLHTWPQNMVDDWFFSYGRRTPGWNSLSIKPLNKGSHGIPSVDLLVRLWSQLRVVTFSWEVRRGWRGFFIQRLEESTLEFRRDELRSWGDKKWELRRVERWEEHWAKFIKLRLGEVCCMRWQVERHWKEAENSVGRDH